MLHRLLLCPARLEKACQLRTDIAHRLAKGSNHQWPTEAPPNIPELRALLHAHWGKQITLRSTEPPAKNPLNVATPYDETDGLHICSNDAVKDGTFNPDFYKNTNPIMRRTRRLRKRSTDTSSRYYNTRRSAPMLGSLGQPLLT